MRNRRRIVSGGDGVGGDGGEGKHGAMRYQRKSSNRRAAYQAWRNDKVGGVNITRSIIAAFSNRRDVLSALRGRF